MYLFSNRWFGGQQLLSPLTLVLFEWNNIVYCSGSATMADKFEMLEQQLELFIENTRQIGIVVSDFQPQGQNVLNQKL